MTPRPLTDAQLAAALRAYLPVAHAGLHERIRAEITTTPQQRRLFSILGRLTDADPIARRRVRAHRRACCPCLRGFDRGDRRRAAAREADSGSVARPTD